MSKCKTEVFARVTGFFRPVQSWNPGKRGEFKDRVAYNPEKVKDQAKEVNSNVG